MKKNLLTLLVACLLVCAAAPAYANTVVATDAGALPGTAQDLTGMSVNEITGSLSDPSDPLLGVAMFKIDISDYLDFSAITVGSPFGVPDTELLLFDASGNGVYANDDIDGGNTLSCLPSADGSNPCPSSRPAGVGPTSDGIYYLAVTSSANLPLSAAGEIFTILDSTDVVGPDLTMGGGSPITDWDGGAFTSPDFDLVDYDILLTGVPEPSTWALLLVSGLVALLLANSKKGRLLRAVSE